jgi:hypothetical protein
LNKAKAFFQCIYKRYTANIGKKELLLLFGKQEKMDQIIYVLASSPIPTGPRSIWVPVVVLAPLRPVQCPLAPHELGSAENPIVIE